MVAPMKIRQTETFAQTTRRLAERARHGGSELYQDEISGQWFATSRRNPGKLHQLTAVSCTCLGFQNTGACGHLGMLLEELRFLPDDDPTPPATSTAVVICDHCDQPMEHVNGVTFRCPCGQAFTLEWDEAPAIDRVIAERSQADDQLLDWIERMLSVDGAAVPAGADSDCYPCRGDVPGFIGRFSATANDVAATMIWRADLDARTQDDELPPVA